MQFANLALGVCVCVRVPVQGGGYHCELYNSENIYTYTYRITSADTQVDNFVTQYAHICIYIYKNQHIYTYICKLWKHIHIHMQQQTHIHIHQQTHIHTYTHTYTYTTTNTYTHIHLWKHAHKLVTLRPPEQFKLNNPKLQITWYVK